MYGASRVNYTPYEGPSLSNLHHNDRKSGVSDMKLEGNRSIY